MQPSSIMSTFISKLGLNEADTFNSSLILVFWVTKYRIGTQRKRLDAEVIKGEIK